LATSWLIGLASGVLLTLWFLFPVIQKLSTHLPSAEDGLLIAYIINWITQSLVSARNIYQVPFFHPFEHTLAYSDPFLSTGLLNIPLSWFTTNLVVMSNIHVLVGTVMCFASMFALSRLLHRSIAAAFLSASVFTFSSLHLHYVVHLHTYLIAGLPLMLYGYILWLRSNRWPWGILTLIAVLYQGLNAPMTGFFAVFMLGSTLVQADIRRVLWQRQKVVLASLLITALSLGLFYFPYFQVSQEFNYTRSIRDAAHFAHSVDRLLDPELLLLYCVIGWLWSTAGKKLPKTDDIFLHTQTLVTIASIGVVLMLGPALKLQGETFKIFGLPIPLPYAVLYYVVPGFQAFRTSSRWIVLLNVGVSLLLGKLLSESRLPRAMQHGLVVTTLVFLWLAQVPSLKLYPINQSVPDIYHLVKAQPPSVLAEFPVFSWRMMPFTYHETDRLLYQQLHQQTLYNGASGFTPPARESDWDWLWQEFPASETLTHLQSQGVQLVLVNFSIYQRLADAKFMYAQHPSPTSGELRQAIEQQSRLQLISCTNDACLYTIQSYE